MPPSNPDLGSALANRPVGTGRATWLVLASGGTAANLPEAAKAVVVRVTADPKSFRDILLAEQPRIVVVCQPPATDADLDLVASQRRRRPRLRVMHLAPPGAIAERIAALARGFDDALTTATTTGELAARLAWLEARTRERPAPGTSLAVAPGLELDLVAHEVRRDGIAVHLRPKEFGLLALLASHPGRAYTRHEILERVWGKGHEGGARTVDVHIRWLRKKIEADPQRPVHLVTVRGVGYRLDPPLR